MTTIYVFCNSCEPEWHSMVALGADGRAVAGHICSHHGFAQHDMGFTSNWKHESYNEAYPDGWQLEWVDNPRTHAGLATAIEAHKARAAAADAKETA